MVGALIGRYLATLGSGPELIPSEPKASAKFEQAASVEYSHFDPIALGIAIEKVFKTVFGGVTDEKRVEELLGKLEGKLEAYEAILAKQKYLGGDVRSSSFSKCALLSRRCWLTWLVCRILPLQIYSISHMVR